MIEKRTAGLQLRYRPKRKPNRLIRFLNREAVCGYVFASPFIIGFLAFTIVPMLYSLYISFTSYRITSSPTWIGLDNYVRMFTQDPRYINSIKVTLKYVAVSVPLKVGFALFIAFLLTRRARGMPVYRSIYYLPSLIGGSVAVSLVWKELFAVNGVINKILSIFGVDPIQWLGDPTYAIWVLILLSAWQFGSSMLIFAAGLKQIPAVYYEAAQIDGASGWQQFLYITIPSLSPVIFFNVVMQTISAFLNFTQAFIITQGRPMDSTLVYSLYLYYSAFNYYEMGYASAMAWVLLIMVAVVTAFIFKSSSYWVFYESKGGGT
ncbi:MAG TPA: sugar ABC transporter permease [Firmicutes bacterium]|nr:sugar ABC transporter permease [Bacillota bacterium]